MPDASDEELMLAYAGGDVVTGWFGGTELNYIDQGLSKDSTKTSASPIYLIGGNRAYQATVRGACRASPVSTRIGT